MRWRQLRKSRSKALDRRWYHPLPAYIASDARMLNMEMHSEAKKPRCYRAKDYTGYYPHFSLNRQTPKC
jgi:hypothetical protein